MLLHTSRNSQDIGIKYDVIPVKVNFFNENTVRPLADFDLSVQICRLKIIAIRQFPSIRTKFRIIFKRGGGIVICKLKIL